MPSYNQTFLAFTLTDETFAINISDRRQGLATGASMAGVGIVAWVGWTLGTLIGSVAAGWIGDPAAWGLDYAMPAMFTALFVALAENRRHVIVGVGAAVIMLVLPLLSNVGVDIPTAWHIIIAAMTAATAGAVVFDE
jgi:predicted branched-subunit amino acid permease